MSLLASLIVVGPKCLDGRLHLSFERSSDWPPDEAKEFEAAVHDFVAAGELAAFPCSGAKPGQQALEVRSPFQTSGPTLDVFLFAKELEPRAFQFLRHMVSRIEHAEDEKLLRITVAASATESSGVPPRLNYPIVDYDNEEDMLPEPLANPGFAIEWDDELEYSKSRRLLVEFPSDIEGPAVDRLEDYAKRWGRLLERSAFTLPLGMPDVLDNVMGSVSQFDSATIEIEVPVYQSGEYGWDVLLNMLATFHLRERPIALVTVE